MSCVRHTGLLQKPKVLTQMRKCRNWQTSKTKDLVAAMSCGFKSHLPHFFIVFFSFLSDTPLWFHRSYNTYVTPYSCAIVSFGPVSRSICSSHFFSCSSRFCLRSASFRDRTVSFSCFLRSSTTRKSESCSHSNILCH